MERVASLDLLCLRKVKMQGHGFNRTFGIAPVVMSLMAFTLVLIGPSTKQAVGLDDEGTFAALFQTLIYGQLPVVAGYLLTAKWKRFVRVAIVLVAQALAATGAIAASDAQFIAAHWTAQSTRPSTAATEIPEGGPTQTGRYSSSEEALTFSAFAIFSSTVTVGLRTPRSTPDT